MNKLKELEKKIYKAKKSKIQDNQYHKKFLHQLVSSQLDMDRLDYLKLMNKALRTMPSSPRQKDIIKQINVFRKKVKATPLTI